MKERKKEEKKEKPVQQAAAATVPGRRRRPSPAFSLPHPTPGIGPLGPKAPPPPVPGRPRPAVGRNLAGPPLPGRQGLHYKEENLPRVPATKAQLQ
jgi:hypothetical protein